MKRLFDASSIWEAALRMDAPTISGGDTTSLAPYELGNILWKHTSRGLYSAEEAGKMRHALNRILVMMEFQTTDAIDEDSLLLAVSEKLTYYDASYLFAASSLGAELITEDKALAAVAGRLRVKSHNYAAIAEK